MHWKTFTASAAIGAVVAIVLSEAIGALVAMNALVPSGASAASLPYLVVAMVLLCVCSMIFHDCSMISHLSYIHVCISNFYLVSIVEVVAIGALVAVGALGAIGA